MKINLKEQVVSCELIEKISKSFIYHNVYENYGITFDMYLKKWLNGIDVANLHTISSINNKKIQIVFS